MHYKGKEKHFIKGLFLHAGRTNQKFNLSYIIHVVFFTEFYNYIFSPFYQ